MVTNLPGLGEAIQPVSSFTCDMVAVQPINSRVSWANWLGRDLHRSFDCNQFGNLLFEAWTCLQCKVSASVYISHQHAFVSGLNDRKAECASHSKVTSALRHWDRPKIMVAISRTWHCLPVDGAEHSVSDLLAILFQRSPQLLLTC